MRTTADILQTAKTLSKQAPLPQDVKNRALLAMADALTANTDKILAANEYDMKRALGSVSDVMMDRLLLNEKRIADMADGIRQVAGLGDPVGAVLEERTRPDGLCIQKVSVPIGVVAIIYESRPNVTSDAAALTFKSGNVCVLRSGKEAYHSAYAVTQALKRGLQTAGLSEEYVNLVEDTTRHSAYDLMTASGLVDLLIPRGGKGLIRACVENATVPCIETGTGICHIYVDRSADFEKALDIIENAKSSRPSVCNAAEVCLVDSAIAADFLLLLAKRMTKENRYHPVVLRADEAANRYLHVQAAEDTDFDTEFLDYILAVRCVDGVEDAIEHIAEHSTHHSDAIVAQDPRAIATFAERVDSAAVYINASTRFTDGGEFGLGCEMGISTQKLHARGPMGLREMTTYKYIVTGNGHIR